MLYLVKKLTHEVGSFEQPKVAKIGEEFTIFMEALAIRRIPVKLEVVYYQVTVPGIWTTATLEELNKIAKEYNLGSIIDNITDITNMSGKDIYETKIIETVQNKEVPYLPINISYSAHYRELIESLDYLYAYQLKLLAWCYRIEDWHKMRHQKLKNNVMRYIEGQGQLVEPEEPVEYKRQGNYIRGYDKEGKCIVEYVKV